MLMVRLVELLLIILMKAQLNGTPPSANDAGEEGKTLNH